MYAPSFMQRTVHNNMKLDTKQAKKGPCVIYYHGNDWDGTPARQKYLMQALSSHVPVIYLDGGFDRRGQITIMRPSENVTVIRGLIPLMIALRKRGLHWLFSLVAKWHLHRVTKPYGQVIFWNAENWLRPYHAVHHDALIFDCIDPAFTEDAEDQKRYDIRERKIIAEADLVFATAEALAERCREHHPHVFLLNNACEPAEYAANLLMSATRPAWWPATSAPVAAYLGSIDWRFDFHTVETACLGNPDVHFILAGNILPQYEAQINNLKAVMNVTCPGKVSVNDGRYLLSHCAIGMIPFTGGRFNDAINPVKMYAYALLGKPIVGTSVRELVSRPDIVTTAQTPEGFSAAVAAAVKLSQVPEINQALIAFAQSNTWEIRAEQAWQHIKNL